MKIISCLIKHHVMNMYWGSGDMGGEWSVSRPGRFNPCERAPSTYWIGNWVGSKAGQEV